jgi:hypothetical protein
MFLAEYNLSSIDIKKNSFRAVKFCVNDLQKLHNSIFYTVTVFLCIIRRKSIKCKFVPVLNSLNTMPCRRMGGVDV